jgi:hypothetical protein
MAYYISYPAENQNQSGRPHFEAANIVNPSVLITSQFSVRTAYPKTVILNLEVFMHYKLQNVRILYRYLIWVNKKDRNYPRKISANNF